MNKYKKLAIPYVIWMVILIGIPIIMMLFFGVSNTNSFSTYTFNFKDFAFSLSHAQTAFSAVFFKAFLRSFGYAFVSTLLTFFIGYPIAYIISKIKSRYKFLLLLIFIMPMWTNMLLRIQTLNNLFKPNSFLSNTLGISIDLTEYKSLKIILVMTIVYLPFMIFPCYTVLEKMDQSLIEASMDLGASRVKSFFKITFPLSVKGIFSGFIMVFLPCAMGFTIPQIVTDGDPNYAMLGQLIERQFMSSSPAYNVGSLMSLFILIFTLGSIYLISRVDQEGETLL